MEIPAPKEITSNEEYRPTGNLIRRQVVFLRVETEVVEYITPEYVSKRTGKKVHAAFPEDAKDDVNYDGTVKATAYLLNNQCCVSINKTREFLGAVSGGKLKLSSRMICGLSKRVFKENTGGTGPDFSGTAGIAIHACGLYLWAGKRKTGFCNGLRVRREGALPGKRGERA